MKFLHLIQNLILEGQSERIKDKINVKKKVELRNKYTTCIPPFYVTHIWWNVKIRNTANDADEDTGLQVPILFV